MKEHVTQRANNHTLGQGPAPVVQMIEGAGEELGGPGRMHGCEP